MTWSMPMPFPLTATGRPAFKVVTDGVGTHLYGNMSKGTLMIFR